ncbi:MAG: 4Fe-4S dicluster domain-containing protein [Aigarchaeota archaeon]|nr:4Fe-4S dicluster domain-containing protein [Aigarchaeota archaeon]MDW8092545.1 4Fe-4S dicluster domain-containing protein [Nitrososphaerota archaeon]
MGRERADVTLRELFGDLTLEVERCIRCGFCNSVCPTSLIESAFPPSRTSRGRLVLLQSVLSIGSPDPFTEKFKGLIDLCFGCTRCESVCPAGIPIPRIMQRYRHAYYSIRGKGKIRVAEMALANYHTVARIISRMSPLSRKLMAHQKFRSLLSCTLGIADDIPLPLPEGGTLDSRLRDLRVSDARFAYFADTFVRYVRPSIGLRLLSLLRSCGDSYVMPPQRDSGIVLLELGLLDELEAFMRFNVESLHNHVRQGRYIITTSPAATLMLRHEYPKLLGNQKSIEVSERVVDVHEYLSSQIEKGRLRTKAYYDGVLLHSTCFSQRLRLTALIEGILEFSGCEVMGVVTECCGMGGLWGMIRDNRRVSLESGRRLFERVRGQVVVSNSETCILQLNSVPSLTSVLPIDAITLAG